MINKANAEHYVWGNNCDGWHLVKSDALSVIQEHMPPHTSEVRHYHEKSRQFFYVLSGVLTFEVEGIEQAIGAGKGLEISPGDRHRVINNSNNSVEFLVVSQPTTRGDRVE